MSNTTSPSSMNWRCRLLRATSTTNGKRLAYSMPPLDSSRSRSPFPDHHQPVAAILRLVQRGGQERWSRRVGKQNSNLKIDWQQSRSYPEFCAIECRVSDERAVRRPVNVIVPMTQMSHDPALSQRRPKRARQKQVEQ
ncbi:MAG: hypothetical protein JO283_12385 [Bradyrhizobium sp.]|nr:hypothetical protein [Bradyrhizobium sp.]